ncbi:secretin N-terminal domain-containing protein [Hahella chejuensis]|nr:secretin N-terminal domain-containing protein [Hahella chejuensis]
MLRAITLLLTLGLSLMTQAQRLETITLQHRTAEDMARQVRELYPADQAHISGHLNQLLIRADDSVIDEIQDLVMQLDTPQRQFLITISRDRSRMGENSGWGVSGVISNEGGSARVEAGKKVYSTRGGGQQTLTVVEGSSAFINTGQKQPVRTTQRINGRVVDSVEYLDLSSGVYVEPRLTGQNRVELKVRSQSNERDDIQQQRINTSSLDTLRVVQLGEWVELGGATLTSNRSDSGITYSTRRQSADEQSVLIKVELLGH